MGLCCLIGCTAKILAYVVGLSLVAFGILFLLLKYNKSIQNTWLSYIYVRYFVPKIKPLLVPYKQKIFQDMDKVVSADPELRENNIFRMVEIGIGPGANLCHYPKNCRLISVEPNEAFSKYYEENRSQYPDLVVEKFVTGVAEDMKEIPDGSVDVVVCTHVLCAVNDTELALKEVKRVLSKDGQFLFFEHIGSPDCTYTFKIQNILEPLWKVMAGCKLTCRTEQKIRETGFSKVEVETVDIMEFPFLFRKQIFGKAIK